MARTRSLTFQSARQLASALRTTRHAGRSWSVAADHDLDAQTRELILLAQSTRQTH